MSNNDNTRSIYKGLLLYNEWDFYDVILQKILDNYTCAYIVHDKDTNEDGEIKKIHTHVVIKCDTPTRNSTVVNVLGIEERFIQKINNSKNALVYLIHFNHPEKFQYSLEEVKGDLFIELLNYLNSNIPEEEKFKEFFNVVNSTKPKTISQLINIAIETNSYNILKKNTYLFVNLIKNY